MKKIKLDIKKQIKKLLMFLLNPRLILCFLAGWMITNGWSYIMLGIGTFFGIPWMIAVAGAYLAFLWIPATPEKIVTIAIAIFFLRIFFPKDKYTLGVLREMSAMAKASLKKKKKKKDDGAEAEADAEADADAEEKKDE